MKYIFLVAGKGSRLQPLTLNHPKSMFRLDSQTTLIQRMIGLIRKYDSKADIVVVTGHMHRSIENAIEGVTIVYNPFYAVTNSIASLWFAREHLDSDNLVLIDGDIVMSDEMIRDIVCVPTSMQTVILVSSIKPAGAYNVQVANDKVLVMSKNLDSYSGEYAGLTKLDNVSAKLLKEEIENMVEEGYYDQWYENALVQMIFKNDFQLYYKDICDYDWTEVDCVSDLIHAKTIHMKEN